MKRLQRWARAAGRLGVRVFALDRETEGWALVPHTLLMLLGWATLLGLFTGAGLLLRSCGERVFRTPPPKNLHKVFDTEEMQEEERFEEWLDEKVEAGEVQRVQPPEDR